jgi:hypothetical protein
LLDANKSSLKPISVHINQQKDISGQVLASSACLCHHEINHQHKYELATESQHWLHTITNNPARQPQHDLTDSSSHCKSEIIT